MAVVRQPDSSHIFDGGQHGPWSHLWSPFNVECNGRDPVDILLLAGIKINPVQIDPSERAWLPYTGPLPDSPEYRDAVARYAAHRERTPAATGEPKP